MEKNAIEVMMVEDDEYTRLAIKSALIEEGLDVTFDTSSVASALDFAKTHRPKVALLDFNLGPGPNGIDLANQLRKIDKNIAIVLLTAYLDPATQSDRIAQLPKGSRYLVKHDVSKIQVLIQEIELSIESSKS